MDSAPQCAPQHVMRYTHSLSIVTNEDRLSLSALHRIFSACVSSQFGALLNGAIRLSKHDIHPEMKSSARFPAG